MSEKVERCEKIANYMLEESITIREAAEYFGISKTTVHTELTKRLKGINASLYRRIRTLLDANWADRSRRGGVACVKKYPNMYERLRPWMNTAKTK